MRGCLAHHDAPRQGAPLISPSPLSSEELFVSLLRCPHCRQRLKTAPTDLECLGCGRRSPSPPDTDLVVTEQPRWSLGAAFMGSRLAARIYQGWWRPLTFGLSSGFRKPNFEREAEL